MHVFMVSLANSTENGQFLMCCCFVVFNLICFTVWSVSQWAGLLKVVLWYINSCTLSVEAIHLCHISGDYSVVIQIWFLSHWDPYTVLGLEAVAYSSYSNTVEGLCCDWSLFQWPTGCLQCFNAVGLVIWPVKIVPEMTHNVSSVTLSLYIHLLWWFVLVVFLTTVCGADEWNGN